MSQKIERAFACLKNTIEKCLNLKDYATQCVDPCGESAFIGHCGRPNNTVSYSYNGVEGQTLEEFTTAWQAAGGKTWISNETGTGGGECHWYCPHVPGAAFRINGATQEVERVTPNPNAEALGCSPTDVLGTIGCHDAEIRDKLCSIKDNTDPEPECQWLTLCDEAGTAWLVCINPDGSQSPVVGLDGTEAGCTTWTSTVCITPRAYSTNTTRVRVGADWTDTPADWDTLSEADRLQWHIDLITNTLGAPSVIDAEGAYCYQDVGSVAIGFCSANGLSLQCGLSLAAPQTIEVCVGPEGELVPCEDGAAEVTSTRVLCSSTVGNITEVTVTYGEGSDSVFYVDENNDTVSEDLGELSFGVCPIKEYMPVGLLYQLTNADKEGVKVEYWQPSDLGGNAVAHDNPVNIFGASLNNHPNEPDKTIVLPDTAFSTASDWVALGYASRDDTRGADQIRMTTFVCSATPFTLTDSNTNTGERGAVLLNGELFEDNTNSVGGNASAFDPIAGPIGVSTLKIATSDLTSWQGINPTATGDAIFMTEMPVWKCVQVYKCTDLTGGYVDCEGLPVIVGEKDQWCPVELAEQKTSSTHVVEHCYKVDDQTVDGFVIVNDAGTVISGPKPLTELGFEAGCC